jgi:alanine racemase
VSVTRAEAIVDLQAISSNVRALEQHAGRPVMAVVKADGYGHGLVESAAAARRGGAAWLGTAVIEEALTLRGAGDTGRVLTWLAVPGEDYREAIRADVDVTAYSTRQLAEIVSAAGQLGQPARVQLKTDTGLSRGGAAPADWHGLVEAARRAELDGDIRVTGVWSHFACADEPDHPSVKQQLDNFARSVDVADSAGLRPDVRHLANSAGTLAHPDSRWDLVRPGLAVYGLSPIPDRAGPADLGLVPAMTVVTRLALVKRLPAGSGVSYGHRYVTDRETTVGLVPVGYGDGVPRHASNCGPVLAAGRARTIAGQVCMDQFVLDLGDDPAEAGDEVVLFGAGDHDEPTAQDWAEAVQTISYEIVTRIGGRITRRYVGGQDD